MTTRTRTAVFRALEVAKIYKMGEVKVHALRGVNLELFEHVQSPKRILLAKVV